MYAEVAGHVYRRALAFNSQTPEYDLPAWTPIVFLVDFLLFLPVWIFIGYTLHSVFPVLAMVEDENPPSYQSLATNPAAADANDNSEETIGEAGPLPTKIDGSPRAVTSSLRLTQRIIRAQAGGPRAYLRGLPLCLFYVVAFSFLNGIFSAMIPHPIKPVATLLATLPLVQFRIAWVHTVMTVRSPLPFWRRLPSFKHTFEATAKPTALVWLANVIATAVPMLTISYLDITVPESRDNVDPALIWKCLVVFLTVLVQIFVLVPSQVILTRIQASLLPEDLETIIPFDRSFQGTVEPAVVSGKGYVSIKDAWSTFSRQAWRRLVIMYVKITCVTIAAWVLMALIIVPQVFIIISNSTEKKH